MTDPLITAPLAVRHATDVLRALLPEGLALVATADQVVLVDARSGAAIATHTVAPMAGVGPAAVRAFLHHLLSDVQDLVVTRLRTPWPTGADGSALSAWTGSHGDRVELGFARSGAAATQADLPLPQFVLPRPGATRTAG